MTADSLPVTNNPTHADAFSPLLHFGPPRNQVDMLLKPYADLLSTIRQRNTPGPGLGKPPAPRYTRTPGIVHANGRNINAEVPILLQCSSAISAVLDKCRGRFPDTFHTTFRRFDATEVPDAKPPQAEAGAVQFYVTRRGETTSLPLQSAPPTDTVPIQA